MSEYENSSVNNENCEQKKENIIKSIFPQRCLYHLLYSVLYYIFEVVLLRVFHPVKYLYHLKAYIKGTYVSFVFYLAFIILLSLVVTWNESDKDEKEDEQPHERSRAVSHVIFAGVIANAFYYLENIVWFLGLFEVIGFLLILFVILVYFVSSLKSKDMYASEDSFIWELERRKRAKKIVKNTLIVVFCLNIVFLPYIGCFHLASDTYSLFGGMVHFRMTNSNSGIQFISEKDYIITTFLLRDGNGSEEESDVEESETQKFENVIGDRNVLKVAPLFNQALWKSASDKQKEYAILELVSEDFDANSKGHIDDILQIEDDNKMSSLFFFEPEKFTILVNKNLLLSKDTTAEDVTLQLLHASRHAQQYALIQNWNKMSKKQKENIVEDINTWSTEFESYNKEMDADTDSEKLYIEMDADNYAAEMYSYYQRRFDKIIDSN